MYDWCDLDVRQGFSLSVETGPQGVRRIEFEARGARRHSSAVMHETMRQLQAYFEGELKSFDVPLEIVGTDFQKRVWKALRTIPYGQTRSYSQIAAQIGSPQAVRAVGGFDPALRFGEDADLGRRLLAAGWQVVADPALHATCLRTDSLGETLARYARWNSPQGLSWSSYLRQISYAIKVMAREDLRERDPIGAAISLFSPHYQFWSHVFRRGGAAP